MPDLSSILQAAATIFALVNPAVCAMMLLEATKGESPAARRMGAIKAVGAITAILLIAAFAGTAILQAFGISFAAFSVAGGAVLAVIGTQMMQSGEDRKEAGEGRQSLTPLIVFAASPGTITGVITIASARSGGDLPLVAVAAIAVVMATLLAVLLFTASASGRKSEGGQPGLMRKLMTNYMGLIVIAMGIQFMLEGWRDFMG